MHHIPPDVEDTRRIFEILAHPVRLDIIFSLGKCKRHSLTLSDLARRLCYCTSNIKYHLGILFEAGMVRHLGLKGAMKPVTLTHQWKVTRNGVRYNGTHLQFFFPFPKADLDEQEQGDDERNGTTDNPNGGVESNGDDDTYRSTDDPSDGGEGEAGDNGYRDSRDSAPESVYTGGDGRTEGIDS